MAAAEIRAGASLVTAGLMADGITEVTNAGHVLRGYDHIILINDVECRYSNCGRLIYVNHSI